MISKGVLMGKCLRKYGAQVAASNAGRFCFVCLMCLMFQPAIVGIFIPGIPPAEDLSLIEGKSVERELSQNEIRSYSLELSPQSFLRIDFYSPYMDLIVSMVWPSGKRSLEWHISRRTDLL